MLWAPHMPFGHRRRPRGTGSPPRDGIRCLCGRLAEPIRGSVAENRSTASGGSWWCARPRCRRAWPLVRGPLMTCVSETRCLHARMARCNGRFHDTTRDPRTRCFVLMTATLVLAATDLTNHLACAHLTQQRLAIARGERAKPRPADDPHAELIRERGEAHEREQLERLSAECGGHVDLSTDEAPPYTREELRSCAGQTAAGDARRRAADLPGAVLRRSLAGPRGLPAPRSPFRRRSAITAYEVLDTKLARQVKPQSSTS